MAHSNIVREQLKKITTVHFKVDDDPNKTIDDGFSSIVFYKQDTDSINNEIKVIFENYIVTPFKGFNLHDEWNNGIPPYEKIMYGKIVGETPGMYKFEVHSENDNKLWTGWCPKKSCVIR